MFNCSIQSNSEDIYLKWTVIFPGEMAVEFTFDNSTAQNVMMDYGMGISAVLINYTRDEYIESNILVTFLLQHMNGTLIICSTDIKSATHLALFEPSGMS